MSYTKRHIDTLQDRRTNTQADVEYDAEYAEYLRDQERDRLAEEYFENNPEMVTVRKSDDVMSVTKVVVETEENVK